VVAGAVLAKLQAGGIDSFPQPGAGCQVRGAQGRAVDAAIAGAADLGKGVEISFQTCRVDAQGF
jgi:hypothetical protein